MQLNRWALRVLLVCAALLSARAVFSALHGGGGAALLPASLAWALLIALASSVVRACRLAASGRLASPASAWWGLALAHGAAWSVVWAAQLGERGARVAVHASPLAGAALNASFALALGLAVSSVGLQALSAWHLVLGAAAAFSLLVGILRPSGLLQPR